MGVLNSKRAAITTQNGEVETSTVELVTDVSFNEPIQALKCIAKKNPDKMEIRMSFADVPPQGTFFFAKCHNKSTDEEMTIL